MNISAQILQDICLIMSCFQRVMSLHLLFIGALIVAHGCPHAI